MEFQFTRATDNREFLNTFPEHKITVPDSEQFSSLEGLHGKYVEVGISIVCWNSKQHLLPRLMNPPRDL